MANLGDLYYSLHLKDLTDKDFQTVNAKLKNLGYDIKLTPKILKEMAQANVPKGVKIELDPQITNDALSRAAEGKAIKVEVQPLISSLRKGLKDAFASNPAEIEIGIPEAKLRTIINNVLHKQGFMINVQTVDDNFTKVIQQKLQGRTYTVKIHADAAEITRSVQASLMQVQSRTFGLKVSKDVLYRSIDDALYNHPFKLLLKVDPESIRKSMQDAVRKAAISFDSATVVRGSSAMRSALEGVGTAQRGAASAAKDHAAAANSLSESILGSNKVLNEFKTMLTSLVTIRAFGQLRKQIVDVGGELEHQKIALDTIFGDKGKTEELFGQIKSLARQSPFGVMELTKNVKQLSAFGVQYNEIYETSKRLADISAATSVDISRLILAFGKTKSRGFLDGLEAKQFAYANIPIYEMVRKKLEELEGQAVTTAEVMKRIKKREIGFDIVKDVLWDLTDEGGKFYNMQEALAGSVKTSWKLVKDNIELMFGEIAESSIGDSLKSTAELLQNLTRNWKSVATVVGTAVAGYGVYRIATLGVNQAVQKETLSLYNNIIAQKRKNAENLKGWGRITQLDKAEKMRIATANKLTNADLRQALAEGKLNERHISQLFWQKKITAEQVKYLTKIGLLNPAMEKAILSNNRLTLSLQMLGNTMSRVGKAIGSFLLNPWTVATAGLSGAFALWQRYSEQMDKSKDAGDNLFTKASEGAKNLKTTLSEVGDELSSLVDFKLKEAIEKLETAIRDYSPNAESVISRAKVSDDGAGRSRLEYAEALKAEVEALEAATRLSKDINLGQILQNSVDNAKGLIGDNLFKDIEQYVTACRDADKEINRIVTKHPDFARYMIEKARKNNAVFAEEIKDMEDWQAQFSMLIKNADKYDGIIEAFNNKGDRKGGGYATIRLFSMEGNALNLSDFAKKTKDLQAELSQVLDNLYNDLVAKEIPLGADMPKHVEIMLRKLAAEMLEGLNNLDPSRTDEFRSLFFDKFGLNADDSAALGAMSQGLSNRLSELGDDLARDIRNGKTYDKFDDEQKKHVDELMKDVGEEVKKKLPHLGNEIDKWLSDKKWVAEVLLMLNNNAKIEDWKQELVEKAGGHVELIADIKGAADIKSMQDAVRKGYKAAQDTMSSLKGLNLPMGLEFKLGKKITLPTPLDPSKLPPMVKEAIEEWNKAVDYIDSASAFGKDVGFDPSKSNDKSGGGNKADKVAERLKHRLDILKKAYSEYKKELASMSRDAALSRIKEAGIFDSLFTGKDAINDFDDYEGMLRKMLSEAEDSLKGLSEKNSKFKGRHDVVVSLRTLLNLEIPRDKAKEELDRAKETLDALIKEFTRKWELQEQMFGLTGNRDASINLAFGEAMPWQAQSQMLETILNKQLAEKGLDVPLTISDEEAKEKLKGTPLYDLLWKPTKEAKLKETVDLQLNVAKAVADAATISEKIQKQIDMRDAEESRLRASKKEDGSSYSEGEISAYLKKYNDEIVTLKSSMLELLPVWEQIFGDHQYQSYGQIQKASDMAKQIIDNAEIKKDKHGKPVSFTSVYTDAEGKEQQITGKISQLDKLRKAINDLYKEGEKKNPFRTLWKALQAVFNGDWKDKDTAEKIALISQSAADCADMVGNLAGQLATMFEAMGDEGSAQAMTDIQDVMSSVSNIGKGFAQGGIIGGIAAAAGEAIGWVTKAFQASARHKEALQAIMNETISQQREYNLLLMEQSLLYEKADTMFGNDTYGKAKNAVKVLKQASRELQEAVEGTAAQKRYQGARASFLSFFGFKDPNAELKKAYAGLADIEIKTGHKKTGLFGWGKGKDIYSSILDVYPDLIDANGEFNKSLAETIINTRTMSEEDKAALQNLIDMAAQAEAAYKELNSFMTDIFGDLGNSMTDALVSAFANGTDAAEAFYESVSGMLEALAKQMIYSVTLAPILEEAQKRMMDIMQDDSLSDDQKFKAWTETMDGMLDDALKQQGVANDLLSQYQRMAEDRGFDIFKPDSGSKSAMTAGLQSLTENTGDLMASYMNAIRADTSVIRINWDELLKSALPQMNVIAEAQLAAQRQIADNTLRNAVAAEMVAKSSEDIHRLFVKVTQGGAKVHIQ